MGKRSVASEADAAAGGGNSKNKITSATGAATTRTTITNDKQHQNDNTSSDDDDDENATAVAAAAAASASTSAKADGNNSKDDNKNNKDKNNDVSNTTTTKRQRRKQLQQSEKNKWPQHPHIKTMAAREQAYLRVAGLATKKTTDNDEDDSNTNKKKKKKKKKDTNNKNNNKNTGTDNNNNNNMVVELRWGRCLASTEARTRHAAVQQLQNYLKAKCHPETGAGISEMDLLKLCKALWYTLYMADHAVVQHELSHRMAKLLWCLAGTEEEDEYAGQAYLEMLEGEEDDEEEGDDDDNDVVIFDDEDDDNENVDDDDQILLVEEEDSDDDDDDDDEEEDDDYEEQEDDDESEEQEGSEEEEEMEMEDLDALQVDDEMDDDDDEEEEHNQLGELRDQKEGDDDDDDDDDDDVDDSEIPHCRGAHLASLFVRTLFRTIRREWGNMDKYRIDKFYTLMRLILEQMFTYMAQRHWNLGIIRLFNDTLVEEILTQTPNGLRNHLIDITLEELAKVNASANKSPIPLTEATFFDCLEPYLFLAQTGGSTGGRRRRSEGKDDQIQSRVLDRILVKFLNDYSVVSDNYNPNHVCSHHDNDDNHDEDDNNNKTRKRKNPPPNQEQNQQQQQQQQQLYDEKELKHHLVFDQVHVGSIAKALFDMASDGTTTLNCYRKSLYDMHKMYIKRLKEVGRDVVLDIGENDVDEEELDEEEREAYDDNDDADEEEKEEEEDEVDEDEVDDHHHETKQQKRPREDGKGKTEKNGSVKEPVQKLTSTEKKANIKSVGNDSADEQVPRTNTSDELSKAKKKRKKEKKRKRKLEEETAEMEVASEPEPPSSSEKKKKEKKKKDKDKSKVTSETNTNDQANVLTSDALSSSSSYHENKTSKKQKKQKLDADAAPVSDDKKKKKKKDKNENGTTDANRADAAILPSPAKSETKEAKLNATNDAHVDENNRENAKPETLIAAESEETKKKKRKRKKRKQQQEAVVKDTAAAVQEDVVVTISVAEQKKAAKAAAAAAAAATTQSSTTPPPTKKANSKKKSSEKAKRVSFGSVNPSKSYISSIKALRTMNPPPLVKKSPEEGILLNKDTDPAVRKDLLGKNLEASGGGNNRRSSKNKMSRRLPKIQTTKSVWSAPFTPTAKSRKNAGGGPNVRRDLPPAKRRKASDYF